ncbi:unnamed protein product [Symbiodinium necroappetens]|uniref:Uncharacterized protein n=1 Tax=Symbiodinium necroappetens TaxID=1628268 RepID=A0A812UJ58_9DINO|nr:unnamed protein product [Symbiodinium necroappetens]
MEGLSPKVLQAQQAKELYLVLENVFEEMKVDWTSVREDEVCMNFRLCLHLLAKYGLAIPYPKTFEDWANTEGGWQGYEDTGDFPAYDLACKGVFPAWDIGCKGVFPAGDIACKGVFPRGDAGCQGRVPKLSPELSGDSRPLLPEGAVLPPGIAEQLQGLPAEDAESLLQAQAALKAEIRADNKKRVAAKSRDQADPKMEAPEEPEAKPLDPMEKKPKLSKDHTVEDMLDMLEPAFAIGLQKPSDLQKQKKCLARVSVPTY